MKKITLFICSFAIATTAFTQIKTNKIITKSNEPLKQNTAMMVVINNNKDSIELNQLHNAFKIADADATNKLQKLFEKMQIIHSKNINQYDDKTKTTQEIAMVDIQQLLNKRSAMLQLVTNMINAINESNKIIAQNIGR
jgi:acetolactate synthase small subunit